MLKRWELIMYMPHIIRKLVPKRICRQHNKIPRSNICFSENMTITRLFLWESAANVHILPVASMIVIGR